MKNRAPDILDFIATVAAPRLKKNVDAQVPPVCMVYAMMVNQRWQELSLVQKIATIILGVGRSSKKVNLAVGRSKIFKQKGPKKLWQSASPPSPPHYLPNIMKNSTLKMVGIFFFEIQEKRGDTDDVYQFIFFSSRERAEFNKSCNLIGSWSGRNFLIRTATADGIRRVDYFSERSSGNRHLSPFLHFHRRLINASLSLFTFKWKVKVTVSKFS